MNWRYTLFDDLPDSLVADILSRLQVKTLVQSTCVCKIWYSIIKSASFISGHLSHSISDPYNPNYYIFLLRNSFSVVTVISDNPFLKRHPDFIFPFETQSKSFKLVGSCNGLICVMDSSPEYQGRDIYLVNPFIHKYKKLDVGSSCYVDLIGETNYTTIDVLVGFGYSEFNDNDYKVVRIIHSYSDTYKRVFTSKVEIYGLKSGKWKCVDVSNDINISPYASSMFVHGCLYWRGYRCHTPDNYLICFDLKDEVFSRIEFPTTFHRLRSTWSYGIMARNGSLDIVSIEYPSMRICSLVSENKFGGHSQWKELYYECADFLIPLRCAGFGLMGFSGGGRLIIKVFWGLPTEYLVAVDLDNSCAVDKLELDLSSVINGATNVLESLVLFSN